VPTRIGSDPGGRTTSEPFTQAHDRATSSIAAARSIDGA
jgi:hypothetical protein